jgi:iron only hydrogenase large subunit-like protein/nitrogen-specific signal transduction histidine kinase
MRQNKRQKKLLNTLKDRCRVCYTCVRECPAKAIKIINGQAEVLIERCIGCGNCTRVCSQGAKVYYRSDMHVSEMLDSASRVVAMVAPSFPAEFTEIENHRLFVGMMKKLGFDHVFEVGFGADLVALEYKKILENKNGSRYISSDCPAIVNYIRQYHPGIVPSLARIVSPMVAMSRVVRKKLGNDIRIVFTGPCVAKKEESDEVEEVITFAELRKMFQERSIDQRNIAPAEFDEPRAGKGAVFPISRGLLQTVDIKDNAFEGRIIVAEGRADFQEALKEFEAGLIGDQHLELLCCEGCIMGPGMSEGGKHYVRRSLVSNYAREKIRNYNRDEWAGHIEEYKSLDLKNEFEPDDQRLPTPSVDQIKKELQKMGKSDPRDFLNCGACGYETCEEHAIAIIEGLAEIEMCLPMTIDKLHNSINDLAVTNEKLVSVQQALKQSEKMASMGQLSAGIAHELNNPLGVVIMYSNILLDELPKNAESHADLKLIVEQANRCKKIVSGLLNFARKNQVYPTEVSIEKLVRQALDAIIIPGNIITETTREEVICENAYVDAEQVIQALTNLFKNAVEAMPDGGKLSIVMKNDCNRVEFRISDTGTGIRDEDKDKIFEPFYTTKGIGKGTGLGLATTYGIVKMHNGQIDLITNADAARGQTGTSFIITLPVNNNT